MQVIIILAAYFLILLVISRVAQGGGRERGAESNDAFFRAHRRSPWPVVAFGMVGASFSGVSFVSVPGMVIRYDMTYLQTCMGFILGYLLVAYILLPVYYRMDAASIYTYLRRRFGERSYVTGAVFFLISDMCGSALKFYVACAILQRFAMDSLGVPFWVTVPALTLFIWLYTRRGGIKALVWTDTFQTAVIILSLLVIIYKTLTALDMTVGEAAAAIARDPLSRVFVFDDWVSPRNFFKQFVSGAFIVVVMTGLNQNMMQKNLTCRTLREARKDMCVTGLFFLPVNMLFLSLGILLLMLGGAAGGGDDLLPAYAATGRLGTVAAVLFIVGVFAASTSTADSSLTAITTSMCVDILQRPDDERLRRGVHIAAAAVFVLFILCFRAVNSTSLIDAVYILVSYTYGPLLGLYAFGLLTRRAVNDRLAPLPCAASPLLCLAADRGASLLLDYHFGYELLLLNGGLTFIGLYLCNGRRCRGISARERSLRHPTPRS